MYKVCREATPCQVIETKYPEVVEVTVIDVVMVNSKGVCLTEDDASKGKIRADAIDKYGYVDRQNCENSCATNRCPAKMLNIE